MTANLVSIASNDGDGAQIRQTCKQCFVSMRHFAANGSGDWVGWRQCLFFGPSRKLPEDMFWTDNVCLHCVPTIWEHSTRRHSLMNHWKMKTNQSGLLVVSNSVTEISKAFSSMWDETAKLKQFLGHRESFQSRQSVKQGSMQSTPKVPKYSHSLLVFVEVSLLQNFFAKLFEWTSWNME